MTEKHLLWISILATGVFAVMGVVWGIASGSDMIVFDGVYSLVSLGLSLMSLRALKEIAKGESHRFPFGKAQFEPMMVAFKSVTIIGVCMYAASDSVMALLRGGRDVAFGWALIYAVIATGGSLAVALLLMRRGRRLGSALIDAEKNQWLGDTLLSLCVLVAFGVAFAVLPWSYPAAIPYVDPAMVVVASCLFLALPARSLLSASRELLFMRADAAIADRLEAEAQAVADRLNARHKVHVIAIGRQLEVEVNFLIDDDRGFTVSEMDTLRRRFIEIAESFKQRAWVNLNLTREASQL